MKLNKNGFLETDISSSFCPYNVNSACGLWCPLFEVVNKHVRFTDDCGHPVMLPDDYIPQKQAVLHCGAGTRSIDLE